MPRGVVVEQMVTLDSTAHDTANPRQSQSLAALQSNTAEGPGQFWRTTLFQSLAICIFKFFFLKSSALQKKKSQAPNVV